MKLSVIVPLKKIDESVIKCIDSIVNQDDQNFEVIVVDEENKDNSASLLGKYNNIPNINVYNYNNTSDFNMPKSSLNYGLAIAKGEYVMFALAEDYFADGFLNELMDYLVDNDIVKCDFTLLGTGVKKEKTIALNSNLGCESLFELIDAKDNLEHLNKYVMKKQMLIDTGIILNKDDFYSDLTICSYLILKCDKFYNSELNGYLYRLENETFRKSFLKDSKLEMESMIKKYDYLLSLTCSLEENIKEKYLDYISTKVIKRFKTLPKTEKKEFKKIIKEKRIKKNIIKKGFFRK